MGRFGFCGGTYTSQSVNADAQEAINLYVENDGSGMGASAASMFSTPGLSLFNNPAGNQVRGNFTITTGPSTGRTFKVVDATLMEELANGTTVNIGNVGNDGSPVSFAACPQQLAVVSAGNLYSYQLATQTVPPIAAGTFTGLIAGPWAPASVTEIAYIDSFIFSARCVFADGLCLEYYSMRRLGRRLTIKTINTYADNVIGMIADHRFLVDVRGKANGIRL